MRLKICEWVGWKLHLCLSLLYKLKMDTLQIKGGVVNSCGSKSLVCQGNLMETRNKISKQLFVGYNLR